MYQTSALQQTLLFKTLSFHFSVQQLDNERFYKLSSDVEVLDLKRSQLDKAIFQEWLLGEYSTYYYAIKILDTSISAQLIIDIITKQSHFVLFDSLSNLIFREQAFLIICNEQSTYICYGNEEKAMLKQIKQNPIKGSYVVYIYPSTQKEKLGSGRKNIYSRICKLLNACYIRNSITFKYICQNDLRYLLNDLSYQAPILAAKLINIWSLLSWDQDYEDLQMLFSLLSQQQHYVPEEKEFKSFNDYFNEPDSTEKTQVISKYLEGQTIFFNNGLELWATVGSHIREQIMVIKINGIIILNVEFNKQIEQILKKHFYKYFKRSQIVILEIESGKTSSEIIQEIEIMCSTNRNLFAKQELQITQTAMLLGEATQLFLKIQDHFQDNHLEIDEQQFVRKELKSLFFKSFIINNL